LAALEQLPDLTVIVRHGQVTDHWRGLGHGLGCAKALHVNVYVVFEFSLLICS
jgi:hypothetical protein